MITCEVELPDHSVFLASIIYASNCPDLRKELWESLVNFGISQQATGKPWIVPGDFNQTLDPKERSSSPTSKIDKRTRLFKQCLLEANLVDLNFRGNSFTWWNKSKISPVAKRMDRVLVNDQWAIFFPSSVASFGSPDFSDHCPSSVILNTLSPKIKQPFKFFNFLLQTPEFYI